MGHEVKLMIEWQLFPPLSVCRRVSVDEEKEVEKEVVSCDVVSLLQALTSAPALRRLLIDSDIPF